MGDKTQVATVMLAAQYQAFVWVVIGTTLGMLLANAPVVWLGHKLVSRVPLRLVHGISAAIFAVLRGAGLAGAGALEYDGPPGLYWLVAPICTSLRALYKFR